MVREVALDVVLPDADHAILIRDDGLQQHGAHHREERGDDADAEAERRHREEAEEWPTPQRADGVTHAVTS
jgi:hypothetical protein